MTPPIAVGELIEYGGTTCEVMRVSPAAAYIRTAATRTVTVEDHRKGTTRVFEAHETNVLAISPNASVRRLGWVPGSGVPGSTVGPPGGAQEAERASWTASWMGPGKEVKLYAGRYPA